MQYWVNGQWADEIQAGAIKQTPGARMVTDAQIAKWSLSSPTEIYADATAGPLAVVLPDVSNIIIYKKDSSTNIVTIQPRAGETIMYQPAATLTMQGETIHLRKHLTNWDAIG
jgi:hypothetical protein